MLGPTTRSTTPDAHRRQAGGAVRGARDGDVARRIKEDQHALAPDRRPPAGAQVGPPVEWVVPQGEVHLVGWRASGHGATVVGVQPDDPPSM